MNEIITEVRDEWIRENLLSDKVLDAINSNLMPIEKFMAYYRCAAMEVETKFKILNEQCSLQYDRNPIESIKTRIKSIESILKKINRKKVPLNLEAIAENISDIAGVRVICSFVDDIYMLAEYLLQQDDVTLIRKKDYIKNPLIREDFCFYSRKMEINFLFFFSFFKLFVPLHLYLSWICDVYGF